MTHLLLHSWMATLPAIWVRCEIRETLIAGFSVSAWELLLWFPYRKLPAGFPPGSLSLSLYSGILRFVSGKLGVIRGCWPGQTSEIIICLSVKQNTNRIQFSQDMVSVIHVLLLSHLLPTSLPFSVLCCYSLCRFTHPPSSVAPNVFVTFYEPYGQYNLMILLHCSASASSLILFIHSSTRSLNATLTH